MKSKLIAALIALIFSTAALAANATIEMDVDGLVCAFCAQGIEKKLRKQEATADVFVSLEHKLVAVALKPGQDIADDALKNLLTEAGYTLKGVKRTDEPLAAIRARSESK
ncbi:MAG TPA: heavy-metal-associated domain-containing protein [Nevskiaceae bacterium]|nr:heavy-metal-associated domain-containing protein [Nevskiaceae bacterium]